jgi:hypothetical protein
MDRKMIGRSSEMSRNHRFTKKHNSVMQAETADSFRFVTFLDETLCQPVDLGSNIGAVNVGVIDSERDAATEFSDLYMRLLNAALDEINSSLLPRMRERNLAVHVARGISMAGFSYRDQGLGHEEATFL